MRPAASDLRTFLASRTDMETGPDGEIDSFAGPEHELSALAEHAGVSWRADMGAYRIHGADRVSFLQRLLTSSVPATGSESSVPSLLLDAKGRVQVLMDLAATPDAIVAIGVAPALDAGMATLSRYVLGADVRIEPAPEIVLSLRGPSAVEVAAAAGAAKPTGPLVWVRSSPDGGASGGWLLASEPVRAWQRLEATGAVPVGRVAAEYARVARRQPRQGSEITGAEFPQELRLDHAVDFDKGCYLGQETVARIHYRGKVNRLLVTLQGSEPLTTGGALLAGDREMGRITTASSVAGTARALALIGRDFSAAGTHLCAVGAGEVEVVEPLAAP